jgi:glucose-1-phosphate thymidylyltransferase
LKGVVLAGGLGTRLRPLTSVTNKHLLPVYNQPMIYYPIQTLVNAGITDIMVVTGGSSAGEFLRLLGNGKAFGLKHLNYAYQEGEGGIADALSLVEHFAADAPVCVVLGDNIIEGNIRTAVTAYERQGRGAKIILKKVPDPQRFGVPRLDGSRVIRIDEKPAKPQSDYAVIVNNAYIERDAMTWEELEGWWTDAGTFESLLRASNLVAGTGANKLYFEAEEVAANARQL